MVKENISTTQLFSLIFILLLGSALIVGIGIEAERDAWIAVFLATLFGVGLGLFYFQLVALRPGSNLFEIMEYCFSRPIAIGLGMVYIIYFLYQSSRVTRDFSELITVAILPITPIEMISVTFLLVIAYMIYLGFEVFARVTEIFLPYLFLFLFLFVIFLFASGLVDFNYLLPVLGDGFTPVLKALFPTLLTFPFGELIVLTMILPNVGKFDRCKGTVLLAILIGGIFLTIIMFLILITIGPDMMHNKAFPLLTASRRIALGEFIERIEALVVFLMLLSALGKVTIFLYCGLIGLQYIFRVPYKFFALPIAMVVSAASNVISLDFAEHMEEGLRFTTNIFHPPMQLVIPFVIFIMLMIKKRRNPSSQQDQKQKKGVQS
ncbi:GerAB/ArcD/ProY family transporter [Niallia sp. Krafla_26]|uniref:GerAB/ArcD/ProY family transporter n=1 Tax=Niallia sp. Krafla_26 TaxID=3064703 RepID=UPI003D16577C